MSEEVKKERKTQKVTAKITPTVREAIERLAERKDRTPSYIARCVLELNPDVTREYRQVLRELQAA